MWAWLACVAPGPFGERGEPLEVAPPEIDGFEVRCDLETGVWLLQASATSWTGGGVALWSVDLVYIERHAVLVVASEPDATGEELTLDLAIVNDWRAQSPNFSTVFTCADDPNVAFTLNDIDGQPADCRVVGPDADALAEVPGAVPCVPGSI